MGNLTSRPIKNLRKALDGSEILSFQMRTRRSRLRDQKEVPEEIKTPEQFKKLLLRIFPKLQTDEVQRIKAGRWMRIYHLFYQAGYSKQETADETGLTKATVNSILQRIRWTAKGLETHSLKKRKR